MASKNLTHEDIHTGLSQAKAGAPWLDMNNFRSSGNRTSVVPRRFKLFEYDAGFHTVINGLNGVGYAIGSKASFMFRGHDLTQFTRLWRATIERETVSEDQSENIKVRGSFLGTQPKTYRLTVVCGKLVLDSNWPVSVTEEVVTPEILELKMPLENQVYLSVAYPQGATVWTRYRPEYNVGDIVKRSNPDYEDGVTPAYLEFFYFICTIKHVPTTTDFSTPLTPEVAFQAVYSRWH